jgi:hypothetical protein
MALVTFEGTVENGEIHLRENVKLPEHARVYVVVPDMEVARRARIYSPRLATPDHVGRFAKEIVVVSGDAEL